MRLRSLSTIVFLAFAISAFAQDDPYATPGHSGTLPDPAPHISIEGSASGGQLDWTKPLRCDDPIDVAVVAATDVESCEGFDYATLFDQALAESNTLSKLRCESPDLCGPARRYQVRQSWYCYGHTAKAEIVWRVACTKTEIPNDMEHPSANSLKEPMSFGRKGYGKYALGPRNWIEKQTNDPLDCPSQRFAGFTYEETVAGECNEIHYGQYVKRADAAARAFYDSIQCPGTCTKSDYGYLYKEWSCSERFGHADITVKYVLLLKCQ